jgi:hypothetical protein
LRSGTPCLCPITGGLPISAVELKKRSIEKRGRPSVGIHDADLAAEDIDELRQRFDAR